MEDYSDQDLTQAAIVITSLTTKCEKSLIKLTERNSQQTLLINRIRGLRIALDLIRKEIEVRTKNANQIENPTKNKSGEKPVPPPSLIIREGHINTTDAPAVVSTKK
ncbi:hypothetical protein [Mucilaginibacter sp. HD30]